MRRSDPPAAVIAHAVPFGEKGFTSPRTTPRPIMMSASLFVLIAAVVLIFVSGCGGGRSSSRTNSQVSEGTSSSTTPPAVTGSGDPVVSNVSVSWWAPLHAPHKELDIEYGGQSQKRQIRVQGLATGLKNVYAEPYDGIVPSATGTYDTTLLAISINPYEGYTLDKIQLEEYEDIGGIYYRGWMLFPPWAESVPLPDRIDLFAKITWPGGTYKASAKTERLSVGHKPCYGPEFFDLDCHPDCGDGLTTGYEECDDGNAATEICAYGLSSCIVCDQYCFYSMGTASYCGNNGIDLNNGEVCDDGRNNGVICEPVYGSTCEYCTTSCTPLTNPGPNCGDSAVQGNEGEVCDEGGNNDSICSPAYNSECTYCDWTCHPRTLVAAACGDRVVDSEFTETCDEGNTITESCRYSLTSCQVCDASCHTVAGVTSYCGDAKLDASNSEACDDGNNVIESCAYGETACDVCGKNCQFASGTVSLCGDSITDTNSGETCDDGNAVTELCTYNESECEICDATCQLTNEYAFYCGDGNIDLTNGEECDNWTQNGVQCTPAYGGSCSYCSIGCEVIANPGPFCADGVIQDKWEECDDGISNGIECPTAPCNYCDWTCHLQRVAALPECGDGIVDAILGEECDDGNTISGDGCDNNCITEAKLSVGEFTVNTCNITLEIWDGYPNGSPTAEDHDKHILYLNGVKYTQGSYDELFWKSNPLHFKESIVLTQCHNVFTAVCASQGDGGPNTAMVNVLESSQGQKPWSMNCTSPIYPSFSMNSNNGDCQSGETVRLTVDVNNSCCLPAQVCGNGIQEGNETCDDGTAPVNLPPTATAAADTTSGSAPLAVNFTGGCTDADGSCVSYLWDFGDGSPTSSSQNPSHTYSTAGTFTVTLTVTDNNGATGQGSISITATSSGGALANSWLTIPAGDFVMGCATADTQCETDESPKHTVTLSTYKIQKYEVTNAQYKECVTATVCTAPLSANSSTRTPYYGNATYDNYPVIHVDRNKAITYCSWISGRLPTEAEWEKAARGPSPREPIYPWGDGAATSMLANYSSNIGDTTEAGSYPTGTSYYGAMDMAGNAWEWVNDWYDPTYYATSPTTDPQGPVSSPYGYRIVRGGSWSFSSIDLRVSSRIGELPSNSVNFFGFRCAQD